MKLTAKQIAINAAITVTIAAVIYYFMLPPITLHSKLFVSYVAMVLLIFAGLCYLGNIFKGRLPFEGGFKIGPAEGAMIGAASIVALTAVIGWIGSAKLFNASRYQSMLDVQTGDFAEEVEEIDFNQIPMLDRDSAMKLGDRKMGELVDMVSQFEVSDYYSQINYKGRPVRVTPLQYGDVIKWFNNMKQGTPAYIMIDMVTQEVNVVRLEQGIMYSPADLFGRNLQRHLRFRYPTFIFDSPNFEVDENGHPFWVVPRIEYTIGLYGGTDITGVVLCDAVTGETAYYPIGEVPQWVDRAVSSDILIEQFDNWGTLKHGFFNSIFGQKDSLVSTDGYNYLALKDDIWMYSGVSSVNSDQSNVGFVLINQRTKETKYYSVPGADENSAMASAEGQVQNLRYTATFPLLLNIGGQPTYFVSLKDDAQLVKKYGMVNVGQYQVVAIGDTVAECEKEYLRLMSQHGIGIDSKGTAGVETVHGAITEMKSVVKEGNTYFYIRVDSAPGKMFVVPVTNYEVVVTCNVGTTVKIEYAKTEAEIESIISIAKP